MPLLPSSRFTIAWLSAVGLLFAVVVTILVAAFLLPTLTPSWWNPPASAGARGEAVEHDVLREVTRVRPSTTEPWTLTIREDDLNAWLATRLKPWLASRNIVTQWPPNVGLVQADISPDGLRVGAEYTDVPSAEFLYDSPPPLTSDSAQIVWLRLAPQVHPDDTLVLTMQSGGLGRLPLTASHISSRVAGVTGDITPPREGAAVPINLFITDVLMGRTPLLSKQGLPIDAARRVVVQNVVLREGELELTLTTRAAE